MDHYIDVKLLPDNELSETFLMNKVFTKLHKALDDLKSDSIGISFPKFHILLGGVLRIHGTREKLEVLDSLNWVARLADYCDISVVTPVPSNVDGYRTVSRIQNNMSSSKLRRLICRGSIDEDKVKEYEEKMLAQNIKNPFLELESASNGNRHRRYIQFGKLGDASQAGVFDHFGLSKVATIPWFNT